MQHVAVLVGDELHLDVGRAFQVTLVEETGIGEGSLGDLAGALDDGFQLGHAADDVDADATTAGGGLDHHGETQLPGLADGLVVADRLLGARHHREAGLASYSAGGQLVAHLVQYLLGGADEHHALGLATINQPTVLG